MGRRRSGLRKKEAVARYIKGRACLWRDQGRYSGTRSAVTPRRRRCVRRSGEGDVSLWRCRCLSVVPVLCVEGRIFFRGRAPGPPYSALQCSTVALQCHWGIEFWSLGRIQSLRAVETVETLEHRMWHVGDVVVAGVNTVALLSQGSHRQYWIDATYHALPEFSSAVPSAKSAGDVALQRLGRHKCLDFPCLGCNEWMDALRKRINNANQMRALCFIVISCCFTCHFNRGVAEPEYGRRSLTAE